MITINYMHLNQHPIEVALTRLTGAAVLPIKTAYQVAKISQALRAEINSARELCVKLVDKYAKKDENGAAKITQSGPEFVTSEDQKAFEKELADFMSIEIKIDRLPIHVSQLESVKLSPAEVLALQPILTGIEDEAAASA